MKRTILYLLLFASISMSKLWAQTYGLDNADPAVFTKFKIPDTDLRSLWLNTNLNFYSEKSTQNSFYSQSNYYSDFNYNLTPQYYLLNETDNRYLNLTAGLYASFDRMYSETQSSFNNSGNSGRRTYSGNLNVSFTLNNYINPDNVFYSVGSSVKVNMTDMMQEGTSLSGISSYSGSKAQSYIFSFGAGIGKLRNVTPVVSAIRFQERLKQLNMLNGDLSENTIEDLAQQFYKQTYYGNVYVRPDKYFWQGIEKTLSADGVSLNGLNMYADNYLRETVNEVRFIRHEGIILGADIQFNYQNSYGTDVLPKIQEEFYTLGNVYLNYSHQLNLDSQINFNISASGGPNILKDGFTSQEYSLNAAAGYNYEITDRLVTSINNSFNLLLLNGKFGYRSLADDISFSTNYFVEDNLSLNALYRWSYSRGTGYAGMDDAGIINYVNIGFTFYFERGFLYQ